MFLHSWVETEENYKGLLWLYLKTQIMLQHMPSYLAGPVWKWYTNKNIIIIIIIISISDDFVISQQTVKSVYK